MKAGYAYMMASQRNGTVYTGSTSNLVQRVHQHRHQLADGFTKEHGCKILVWFEIYDDLQEARLRERRIKEWNRLWKLQLIEQANPEWNDLFESLI